ncbi:MAG: excinuclease ABC subunit UvrB [Candidatus Altiarchaeota archaeon]
MMEFKLVSNFGPAGSQPQAIEKLVEGLKKGYSDQTLLGVTGSGKTFTMANVIEKVQKPTLVMAPNKTLAAQLYSEFKDLFPENAVEYFVSYYDYYQPEAYLPASDTYIEKDADINPEIEKLRHRTTASLLDRKDVIVVATVSAIYGLGSPEEYMKATIFIEVGEKIGHQELIRKLVDMQYERNDKALEEGKFRVRGSHIDIHPPYSDVILRIKIEEQIEELKIIHAVTGKTIYNPDNTRIYPAVHYLLEEERKKKAIVTIKEELSERVAELEAADKLLEANRIKQKTNYDIELIEELGYCKGIENYSRHLEGRAPGSSPNTLMDFYPDDWLCFIDESHITVPQIGGMYKGDRSRKETLVDYGFRLPSAVDNRPLKYPEFEERLNQVIYVSATPRPYEKEKSSQIVEQIIRPTGLVDPQVEVRPAKDQIEDFISELDKRIALGQRVLATTLTKRMSEDLADYLDKKDYKVKYLHSEIDTLERVDILNELREGKVDVVVGVNLLREGLDLPEVSLVAIMDSDQMGFLRDEISLTQTIGRCSRNIDGRVILYADRVTSAMGAAIRETERRRTMQLAYNKAPNIKPVSIQKKIHDRIVAQKDTEDVNKEVYAEMPAGEIERLMKEAAERMDFEAAIKFREILKELNDGS